MEAIVRPGAAAGSRRTDRPRAGAGLLALTVAALIAGCGTGAEDWPAEWLQTRATPLAASDPSCPNGGLLLEAGLDANGNGVLDARETHWRLPVCDGVAMVRLQGTPASLNCPSGAVQAQLSAAAGSGDVRPVGHRQWCLDAVGGEARSASLSPGSDSGGTAWIARIGAAVPSGHCPGASWRVASGVDSNRNGLLDEGEVSGVQEICRMSVGSATQTAGEARLPDRAPMGQVLQFGGTGDRPWRLSQQPGQRINAERLALLHDGGWSPSGPRNRWRALARSSDGRQLLVAGDETLLRSDDRGQTWVPVGPAQRLAWRGVAMSSDGRHLAAAAADDAIYTSADAGTTWTRRSIGWGWGAVALSDDGRVLLAIRHARQRMLSRDGGQSWQALDPVDQAAAWQALAVSADGQVLVASARGAALQVSTDGGRHWQSRSTSPKASTLVLTGDGQRLLAAGGVDQAGLQVSDDLGLTWHSVGPAALRAAHIVALASSSRGLHLLAADAGGALWSSRDGGAQWQRDAIGHRLVALGVSAEGLTRVALPERGEVLLSASVTTPGRQGGLELQAGQPLALRHMGTGIWTVVAGTGPVLVR